MFELLKRIFYEKFSRAGILFSGKAKAHGKREFININDRLSRLSTQLEGKITIVKRSGLTLTTSGDDPAAFYYTGRPATFAYVDVQAP